MLVTARSRGFRLRYFSFDPWHSSKENFKAVRSHGWQFLTQVRSNRRVDIGRTGNRPISEQPIEVSGIVVNVEGFVFPEAFIWERSDQIPAPDRASIAYMANTHEYLENAEHNASDPFNQRVAVSMAIVAALLAGVSMVGYRTHNKVLQLQGDSNRYRTEAATAEVERSNLFAWFQTRRQTQRQLEMGAAMAEFQPAENAVKGQAAVTEWKAKAAEYKESNKGKDPRDLEGNNLPDLLRRGEEASNRAVEAKKKAAEAHDEAEHVHHQADRFDIAHLAAEIGFVLCSIALLTKKRAFWFIGLTAAIVAIGLTSSAYMIPHDVPSPAAPNDKGKAH